MTLARTHRLQIGAFLVVVFGVVLHHMVRSWATSAGIAPTVEVADTGEGTAIHITGGSNLHGMSIVVPK